MKLGISACLLGESCRYNGDHARDRFVTDTLNDYFTFVPFCPEAVFGTPREAIRLVEDEDKHIHVVTTNSNRELTEDLKSSVKQSVDAFDAAGLSGFILKSKSPTCGLERVKLYGKNMPNGEKKAVGLFANEIKTRYPYLPVEEEGRLQDAWLRENFLMQVYAYDAIKQFVKQAKTFGELVDFHTTYKYLIYAKSNEAYKTLGNIVANHDKRAFEAVLENYHQHFLKAIALKGSVGKTYNVLQHIYGYFKDKVTEEEKSEILEALEEFQQGYIPLITVIKMLRLYIQKFDVTYLKTQVFLNPYPKELALRSRIEAYK